MAKPRVFISSTCYDLKEIRSQIREFIFDYGYEPILSESPSDDYNSLMSAIDKRFQEIPEDEELPF